MDLLIKYGINVTVDAKNTDNNKKPIDNAAAVFNTRLCIL